MKPLTRLAVATIAATLLLGTGANAAMAEDAPTPPVQQSNIQPTSEMLTQEVYLKGPSEARKNMDQSSSFPEYINNPIDGRPHRASPPITAANGGQWVMIQAELGYQDEGWRYISQTDIASSSAAGTYDAAEKLASEATQRIVEAHSALFDGTGTIRSGAGWYSSEDTGKPPLAIATGLGFQTSMTEPYESNGQQWRKISLYADGTYSTAFTLAADVTKYTANEPEPSADPTEEPSVTAAEEGPAEMPAGPVGNAVGGEVGNDQPGNLGLMVGLGALVMAAGGGYLYWSRRKDAGAAVVASEAPPKE